MPPSLRRSRKGWRVRLRVELRDKSQWVTVPADIGADGVRHPGLSFADARQVAQFHADRGRRARLLDPDGAEGADVPRKKIDVKAWGLTMG